MLKGQCVEEVITRKEFLTNDERGWEPRMTSEENGNDIMKALLNDQGESNDERPNFYASFREGDLEPKFGIFFNETKYIKELRGEFYTECEENNLRIRYYSAPLVLEEKVNIPHYIYLNITNSQPFCFISLDMHNYI